VNVLYKTCKIRIEGEQNMRDAIDSERPILLCSWHGRFMFAAHYVRIQKLKVWAISSTHDDSETLAKVLKRWGFGLIRGSSTRGWKNVITSMIRKLKSPKTIIALTNDGPKGPLQIAKSGSLQLARKANAHIIAFSGTASRYFELGSWDKFRLPKPFSTVVINISPSFEFPQKSLDNENDAQLLTDFMNTHQEQTDSLFS
jgi:hypothetical protein